MILDRMGTLDIDQQTEDLIDVDDKVVVLVRWVGRGRRAVRKAKSRWRWSGRVREQAIWIEFFLDRAQALEAVGLSQ